MNRLTCFFLGLLMLVACSYDETLDTCRVRVRLVYPEGSIEPYAGALVELKDANASIFVSETNAEGEAAFNVPAGIYETSSTAQLLDTIGDTWWRYQFNGVRSMIIVSPDSSNIVPLKLTMSKKRIVH